MQIEIVYNVTNFTDPLNLENLTVLRNQAVTIFGKGGLNIADVVDCRFEERIYEDRSDWVFVLELDFNNIRFLEKIELQSIAEFRTVSEITETLKNEWDSRYQ